MNRIIKVIVAAAVLSAAAWQSLDACTGITLKTSGGSTVTGRTIEWASSDMPAYYVAVPVGKTLHAMLPGGGEGMAFTARYAYVGIAVEQPEFIMEGVNEKGLGAGLFYFPGYGKYEEYTQENASNSISDFQLVSYILSSCATVDEVKDRVLSTHVHGIDPRSSTVHWRFTERSGRQIVLEIIDGKCVFYENELGVLTNSPSFDWQTTNLNNYVNLAPGTSAVKVLDRLKMTSFGAGSAALGLPGDMTPPSRFVRAAFFQSTAPVLADATATAVQAFHILNNFDIPVGSVTPEGTAPADIPSATQITIVTDLSGNRLLWRSMHNSTIRCIDLAATDLDKLGYVVEDLDPVKSEPIETVELV